MTRKDLLLQVLGLLPFIICAGGLYFTPELTPRWELGLLTYAAVSLSCLAGLQMSRLAPRWRGLPLLAPLVAWLAQLQETETGLWLLAIVAGCFALLPLRHNRYRPFALGAMVALITAALKAQSYGF